MMKRIIQPELLDSLSPSDPRAIRSRRDLRRINALMCNHAIMRRELEKNLDGRAPGQIAEIGAGDGDFLLRVTRYFSSHWRNPKVRLMDLQATVAPETLKAFLNLGWRAEVVVADVFNRPPVDCDVVIANLFLHHFEEARLKQLFNMISQSAGLFIAIEPRRASWPLFFSRLLWVIGCNGVTRHDAVVSVRAGFTGKELSALWPDKINWQLREQNVGAFSHLFVARKIS